MSLVDDIEQLYAAEDPSGGLERVEEAIRLLDEGRVRVAEPDANGGWRVNEWAKKAILLYFRLREMETLEAGPFEYLDKVPLKRDYGGRGVRVVPPAVARYGSLLVRRGRADAELREHRRVGRAADDGGHLGHGRLVRADRRRRSPVRRRRHRRRARAAPGVRP